VSGWPDGHRSFAAALAGEPIREAPPVLAVVVLQAVAPGPGDGEPVGVVELPVHPLVPPGGARRAPAAAAGDAGVGGVAPVGYDEGRGGPVDGDLALLRRPVAAVPQRGVHRHGPGVRVGEVRVAPEGAHGHVVDAEDDVLGVPDDGVLVEVCGGVEPEVELVLLLAVAAGPHVGVEHRRRAARVAHELHVDLVVLVALAGRQLQTIIQPVSSSVGYIV
jgi:hypothetical protein